MEDRIIIKNIGKKFKIGFVKYRGILARILGLFSGKESRKTFWPLKDISFRVRKGEIVGIIGDNGMGKSTLLRIISRIYKPDCGRVFTKGKIVSLINLNIGMQERLTMKDNIYLVGSLFGMSGKIIGERFNSIVKFAGLEEFVNTKLYQFSNGMLQRLAFSIAVHSNPKILLLDEVFAVGDEDFRKKSAKKIQELVKGGVSVILVSHELWMIEKYCDRVIWMKDGRVYRVGGVSDILEEYVE
ncbi:ABC transporter ATP-binding protein [archaeon]|jgi:ABC-type polysaccharide/polyol phosphate transport system ATPase subunit|nr:ABC transporter ATP-binding protein [archaeon]MBT4241377.1 ABC transporter ATP-binding protein [archaeon]MBT4418198.1 ABC transporter ATP-binding protein [archaeon]